MTSHSNGLTRRYSYKTSRRTTMSRGASLILMLVLGLLRQSVAIDSQCLSYMENSDTNQNGRIDQDEYVVFVDQLADGAFHNFSLLTFDELPEEVRDNFFISACAECFDDPAAVCDCDPSEGIEMYAVQRESLTVNDDVCHQTRYAIANSRGKTLEPMHTPVLIYQLRQAATTAPTPSFYQCQIAITIADVDRSNVLTEEEYLAFLNRLSQNKFPATGFVSLPTFLQTTYQDLSGGEGIVVEGSKPGETASAEQTAQLEKMCLMVGNAINFVLFGEGVGAPIAAGTQATVAATSPPIAPGTAAPVALIATGTPAPIAATLPPVIPGTEAPVAPPIAAGTPAPVAATLPVVPGTAAPVGVSGTNAPNVAPVVAPTIDLPACITLIAAADANLDEELLRGEYIVFLGSLSNNDTFSAMVFAALPEVLQTNYMTLTGAASGKGIIVTGARQDQTSTAEQQAFLGRVCRDTSAALNSRPATTSSTLAPMLPPATLPLSSLSPVSSLTDSPVSIPEPQTSAPTDIPASQPLSSLSPVSSLTDSPVSIPEPQTSAPTDTPAPVTIAPLVNGTVVNGTVSFVIYNAYGFTAKALRFGGIRNSLRRSMNELAKEIINVPQRPTTPTQGSTRSNSNARLRRGRRLLVTYYNLSASINEMVDLTCSERYPEQFLCIAVNASFGIVVGEDDVSQNPSEFYSASMQDAIDRGRLQYYLKLDTPDSPIAVEDEGELGVFEKFNIGFFTLSNEGFWTTSTLLSICYSSVFLCLCCSCFCYLNRGRKVPEESKEDGISAESAQPPKKKVRKSPAEKAKDAKRREIERKKQAAEAKKKAKKESKMAEAEAKKQAKEKAKNDVSTSSGGMFDSMTSGATGMKNQMAMAAMKAKIGM